MIPLSEPNFIGNELKYLKKCIQSGMISSVGNYVNLFEKKIIKLTGSKYAVACINGTSALQICLKLCGVKKNHEVIVPTISFVASVNAIKYNLADPVFMDVDNFFNIDENKTIEFLNNNTFQKNNYCFNSRTNRRISAIIIVHMYGNAASISRLALVCKKKNIKIVEDAAESLGTKYKFGKLKGKHTGTIGEMGAISFNGNKIITSGGGGMILTNKKNLMKKAKYYTTQDKDDVTNYIHNEIGYNFRLSNLHSAVGLAQLEKFKLIMNKKKKIHNNYKNLIEKKIPNTGSIYDTPNYSINNFWLNILRTKNKDHKKIISYLKEKKIVARPIWYPNHLQKMYNKCERYRITNAQKLLKQSVCLPSSWNLKNTQIKQIIKCIQKYFRKKRALKIK